MFHSGVISTLSQPKMRQARNGISTAGERCSLSPPQQTQDLAIFMNDLCGARRMLSIAPTCVVWCPANVAQLLPTRRHGIRPKPGSHDRMHTVNDW